MTAEPVKQIHLAAHFPGVNNTTVWSDPRAGSHIDFGSFLHLARTAERAKFDFLFLAEGLRLREQNGKIYDLDVVGRPDTFTVLAALAAVTDRLGLWVRNIRTGAGAIEFPTPAQARSHAWTDEDRALVADRTDTQFVGTAAQVSDQLERLRDATGADELIITTITHEHADRVRSYQLLAQEWSRR